MVPEKSLGTGIGQIWYRKKVSEPVSEKFGTEKRYRYRYRKYLVPEKSISIGIVQHFGYRHTLPSQEEGNALTAVGDEIRSRSAAAKKEGKGETHVDKKVQEKKEHKI